MILLKCTICSGNIIRTKNGLFCDSCGMPVSEMNLENEHMIESRNRANEARKNFDYDEAIRGYTQLLTENPTDADANWNLALSKFGIEYEYETTLSGGINRVPTIHRLRYENFNQDVNYRNALKYADDNAIEYYMTEGKKLSAIQDKLLELVRTEKDVDVFISFKAEDEFGNRTKDSLIAQNIYEQLTSRGIRTFFSRISLQDVTGDEYEPHIFAALHSAKVMLLVTTDIGHVNYGWVKNEWTRYLDLQQENPNQAKTLIPVYQGVAPEMFPKRIPMREGIDLNRADAMLELIHGVAGLVGKKDALQENQQAKVLMEKMQESMEKAAYADVIRYGKQLVECAPNNSEAWFLLFMAENRVQSAEMLNTLIINWMESRYFANAYEFSRGIRRQILEDVKQRFAQEEIRLRKDEKAKAAARLAEEGSRKQVAKAKTLMQTGQYQAAMQQLDDNIVLSIEVNDLRNDCELGIEYEKIDKKEYLTEQLKKLCPEAMHTFQSGQKNGKGKIGFGSVKVKWRLITTILMAVGFLITYVGINVLHMKMNGLIMVCSSMATIALTLYLYSWACVLSPSGNLVGRIIMMAIDYVIFMVCISVGKGLGTLILVLIVGFSFWISLQDYKELNNDDDKRLYKLYETQLQPTEAELVKEYRERFSKLNVYAPLEDLTTVWEAYMKQRIR